MSKKIQIDANPFIMQDCNQAYKDGDIQKARKMQKNLLQI